MKHVRHIVRCSSSATLLLFLFCSLAIAGPFQIPDQRSRLLSFANGVSWYNNFFQQTFTVGHGATNQQVLTKNYPPASPTHACVLTLAFVNIVNTNTTTFTVLAYLGVSNPYDFTNPVWPYIGITYSSASWVYTIPAKSGTVNGSTQIPLFRLDCPVSNAGPPILPTPSLPIIQDNHNPAGKCDINANGNSGVCGTGVPSAAVVVTNNDAIGGDAAITVNFDAITVQLPTIIGLR